ncbi:MAG: hypothetical protein A2X78_02040 [Gammaproteobacteria bacterium GWE2_37_16]|nr:MAG: hypothetical protein A2X78_02040 [Gammaproteobacteria bacterium GWE2_37_16]
MRNFFKPNKSVFASILKTVLFALISVGGLYAAQAIAAENNLGNLASGVTGSFTGIGSLMIATSYLAGIGFAIAAIFKFKQHRDNPTQIPIGTPLALLIIGIVLIFFPGIIKPAGTTIFGSSNTAGGFSGNTNLLPQ